MFKLEKYNKLLISSLLATSVVFAGQTWDSKPSIDGGVYYPIVGDQTGPYKVNPNVYGDKLKDLKINHGRVPTQNELNAWNKDVMPDGTGLPEGSGTVEEGEELYEAKCTICHGDYGAGAGGYPALSAGNAYELHKTLKNNRWKNPKSEGPTRVFGSYWPQASTLFWYIRDAMPHTESKTLTNDETYALTAYMLYINELNVDGEMVEDSEFELNQDNFGLIELPNKNGFVPNIDGPEGPENVRKFYSNPSNFGAIKLEDQSKRCMSNCIKDEDFRVARVVGGIKDFEPPLSNEKTLPEKSSSGFDVKTAYDNTCNTCHGNGAGPLPFDKQAWAPYLAKGLDAVYKSAINGTPNGMPPKGGSTLSDEEFKQVVDYMLKFK